jgi:hypothetical protein
MILCATEAVIRILTHWAFKNLLFFPVYHLANDVAKSGSDSRIGIDKINDFRDIWLSRDLHWPPLKTIGFDCSTCFLVVLLHPDCPHYPPRLRKIPIGPAMITATNVSITFKPCTIVFRKHDS